MKKLTYKQLKLYISPPPANIDDLVQEKQQAVQKAKTENTQKRQENLNKVNNDIDKSEEQDILRQAENKFNISVREKQQNLEKPKVQEKIPKITPLDGIKPGSEKNQVFISRIKVKQNNLTKNIKAK